MIKTSEVFSFMPLINSLVTTELRSLLLMISAKTVNTLLYDHTSSDKAPFNYILKSILNKENKIWNTNELLDACWNTGGTESISTRLLNMSCLIEDLIDEDTT